MIVGLEGVPNGDAASSNLYAVWIATDRQYLWVPYVLVPRSGWRRPASNIAMFRDQKPRAGVRKRCLEYGYISPTLRKSNVYGYYITKRVFYENA